jgi:hypothetical protein
MAEHQIGTIDPLVEAWLNDHQDIVSEFIEKCKTQECGIKYLPEIAYYLEYGISRIDDYEKMEATIKEKGLDLLKISDRSLYHIPGQPVDLHNDNYLVVVKKIGTDKWITRREMEQLCTLAIEANCYVNMFSYCWRSKQVVVSGNYRDLIPTDEENKRRRDDWLSVGDRFDLPRRGLMWSVADRFYNHPLAPLENLIYGPAQYYDPDALAFLNGMLEEQKRVRIEILSNMTSDERKQLFEKGVDACLSLYTEGTAWFDTGVNALTRFYAQFDKKRNTVPSCVIM